jgi:hypothetical protein
MKRWVICQNDVPVEIMIQSADEAAAAARCGELKKEYDRVAKIAGINLPARFWAISLPVWDHLGEVYI